MKKHILILIGFVCVSLSSIFGQATLEKGVSFSYKDFPQENIFVHFNSSFLVSGENLFYKIYCLNTNTNKLSDLSKIAYVELIDPDKKTIFKHKIILKSGLGEGDFFIKTSIPSGNYKLIAYTQWMRNRGVNSFFQNDITIVNPFRANKKLTVKIPEPIDTLVVGQNLIKESESVSNFNVPSKNEYIRLKTNKTTFSKREKVVVTVKGLKDKFSYGNYSISVKKIDSINSPTKLKPSLFVNKNGLNKIPESSIPFLPELRGEIVSGSVFSKETNTPKANVKVSLSIPGENAIFKIATTNKKGKFYFSIDKEYKNPNAIIQVVNSKRKQYKVELNDYNLPNFDDFVFNDFIITPKINDLILKKSILNQIENAFHSLKNDSILPISSAVPSYQYNEKKYILDDYTRFNTLKETVTEVVEAVYMEQKKFRVKFYNNVIKSDLLPLVLIDGVIIQDHNMIIDYNARHIKSIGIVRDKYIYGGQTYMGVISIKTLKGDYKFPLEGSFIKSFELDKPLVNKKYFRQEYNDHAKLDRIPDFRSQLLWQPNFILKGNESKVSFFTSNNIGYFEICLEGYTNMGKPVFLREIIHVK